MKTQINGHKLYNEKKESKSNKWDLPPWGWLSNFSLAPTFSIQKFVSFVWKWKWPFILTQIFITQSSFCALAKLHFYSGSQSWRAMLPSLFLLNLNDKNQGRPQHEAVGNKHLESFISWAWPIKSKVALNGALGSDRLNSMVSKHWSYSSSTWVIVCLYYKLATIHSFHFLGERNILGFIKEVTPEL